MAREGRKYILVGTRRDAWRRAKGRCEGCGKALIERVTEIVPGRRLGFEVRVWNGYVCYLCEASTPVVLVSDSDGLARSHIERKDLGEAIRRKYPFFYMDYSGTMEMSYYANHCKNCGALIGDHYIPHWMMEREIDWDRPDAVEPLPGIVEIDPARSHLRRQFLPFEIHHYDGNPSNNDLGNLKILCVGCHRSLHAERPKGERGSSTAV